MKDRFIGEIYDIHIFIIIYFLRWVKTFYNNIQSFIMNNGTASNFFTLERAGVATAIRQNETIKGITIVNEETKLLQFADDTTAGLADTDSAEKLFEILNS